jgi:c-di-GMP-binding flagellar brake protein YcgR
VIGDEVIPVFSRLERNAGAMRIRSDGSGQERRVFERFGIPLLFHVYPEKTGKEELFLSARDISADGVFLLTDRALPNNAKVNMRVMLPSFPGSSGTERCFMTLQGAVVRSQKTGMAVRFRKAFPVAAGGAYRRRSP